MTQPVGQTYYGLSGGGYAVPPGSPGPQIVNGAFVSNGSIPVGNPTSGAPGALSLSQLNAAEGQRIAAQYAASAGPRPAPASPPQAAAPPRPMPASMPTGAGVQDFGANIRQMMQNLQRMSIHNAAGPTQPIASAGPAPTQMQIDEQGGQGDDGTDPTTAAGKAAQQSAELAAFDKSATAPDANQPIVG